MTFKAIFAAAAVSALMGGAAQAQSTSNAMPSAMPDSGAPAMAPGGAATMTTGVNPMTPGANPSMSTTTDTTSGTMTTSTTATSATAYGQGASVTTSLTTNGPVPDTPANRAKYGQPMSNAGKRTAAKGN